MEKKKVGVFSWYYAINRDAVFARLSENADFDFTFFGGPPPANIFVVESDHKNYNFHPIRVFNFPIPCTKNSITYRTGVISALIRHQFDVFLLTNDILGIDIWICAVLARIVSVPVIIWGQGLSRPPNRLRNMLRLSLTKLAAAAIYYTEGGKNYWKNRGIPPEKLFVAYNALDTDNQLLMRESLTQDDLDKFLIAEKLSGKTLVTFLGRLVSEKKPIIFLEAIQKASIISPNIFGIIIGDGPERHFLEDKSEKMGISERVRFVGAEYDEKILARYLMSSIAVVLPAFAGLAIQHAAVYGTPLILGDLPNSHGPEIEIIEHEKTGLMCTDEDADAFALAILRLSTDHAFRDLLSKNLMCEIDAKYNVGKMAQGFIDAVRYSLEAKEVRGDHAG
jgi:glycosyltransferase involved in cell wall biosynthesis